MAWRHRPNLILAYVSFFAAIGFSLLVPKLFGNSIDKLVSIEGQQVTVLAVEWTTQLVLALAILGANVARGFSDFARTYATDSLSQKVSFDLRNLLYDKLQHISFAYHDKEHTGNLMSKATSDVESIRRFINLGLVRSLDVSVRIVAITSILLFLDWKLALLSLVFVPFVVLRSTLVLRRLRRMWLHVQEVMGETVTVLQENLVGIHVVKAFASEEYEKEKYRRKAQELREEFYKSERLQGVNSAWMSLYFTFALGLILWFGGIEVINGNLSPGGLAQFVLYMNQLTFPIRASAQIINSFSRAISSGQRMFEVLDAKSPVEEKPDAKVMGRSQQGRVQFVDVSFSYDDRTPALRHVNIDAAPGQVTAILGAPGSGKSTIVNMLPRFYDVTEGHIDIDGVDIRDVTLESLRRNVGIVQQDVYLFSDTIRDNIAYGAVNATLEDVIEAAKVAQLHDHIMSLPDGYDTWVGERGATLSGGQRQRLSIARTVLIDPPVLILDDSTSSVDVETERLIHQAMINVMKGRTTFVIAHRLSTVREADLILVLQDGEIVEQGSHIELMAKRGTYRDIYDLQLRPQAEILLDAAITSGDIGGDN
ncbi:MAG: ABC transporter ATP-binding protein [Chloroflexi bacterium]|nr:ABC transporter ATP-binding protein [Chloroflexota bacterium]MDA1219377.1 ABC transporter ATP-binding protein [Chloroflexota bacterium]